MQITTGQMERWRRVNTASARHLRLSLGGHPFHRLGSRRRVPYLTSSPVAPLLVTPAGHIFALTWT